MIHPTAQPTAATILLLLIAVVTASACSDLRVRRIPNKIVYGASALGLALNVAVDGVTGGLGSIGGWVLGCALLWLPFMMGGMGAGDVKLLAAVGALKGASFVFMAFLYSAVAGGVFAIVALTLSGELVPLIRRLSGGIIFTLSSLVRYRMLPPLGEGILAVAAGGSGLGPVAKKGRNAVLPYGVAIAAGSLIALALGH